MLKQKPLIFFGIVIAIVVFTKISGLNQYLTLEYVQANLTQLQEHYGSNPIAFGLGFALVYIISAAFSLPGAALLSLLAGALFGTLVGSIIVSFASTIGATAAFMSSRYLIQDSIQKKFGSKLEAINRGIEKEGSSYLFMMRLVPIFPFFVVNLLMGLTKFPLLKFFVVSQIGMFPATVIYVNAGKALAQIHSLKDVVSLEIVLSLGALGVFPFIIKRSLHFIKHYTSLAKFKRPSQFDYNIVVIGAGSGGLVSSYIAAAIKAKVLLVEKHKMGGDCLNTGCVPSKAFIKSSKIVSEAKRAQEFGVTISGNIQVDFAKVMDRVQAVIKQIEPHDSVERYTKLGVEVEQGTAQILSPYEVKIGNKTVTTKNIIVATGARPFMPPIPGLETVPWYNSDTIWNLRALPQRLLVMGGGPIGCELAQAFGRLGSKVTLVEMASRLMQREDEDVSEFVTHVFKNEGISVETGWQVTEFEKTGDTFSAKLSNPVTKEKKSVPFDGVLVALGRKANVTGFGLEGLGLEIRPDGTLSTNEKLQTKIPNIYACGDVTGPFQFTHAASHQAWYASVNALLAPFWSFDADYRFLPWTTFVDPEVARIGINETQAKQQSMDFEVTKYGIDDLDRAIAEGQAEGFVKVITKKGTGKILGVTIVGHHAGELITEFVTAMKAGKDLNFILGTIHAYPTFAESNKFAAGNWKRAHAPLGLLEKVKKFHHWRRT